MITRPEFYKGYFHRIIVFSPSFRTDDKWYYARNMKHILVENKKKREILEGVPAKRSRIGKICFTAEKPLEEQLLELEEPFTGELDTEDMHDEFTLAKFQEVWKGIYDEIMEIESKIKDKHNARYYADRILIVVDDNVGTEMNKVGTSNNPFVQFATRHRHLSCSFIVIGQFFKSIPPGVRTQSNVFIGFELSDEDEQYKIYTTLKAGMNWKDWKALYDYATLEPFDFFYFNNYLPRGQRAYRNFEFMLTIGPRQVQETQVPGAPTGSEAKSLRGF